MALCCCCRCFCCFCCCISCCCVRLGDRCDYAADLVPLVSQLVPASISLKVLKIVVVACRLWFDRRASRKLHPVNLRTLLPFRKKTPHALDYTPARRGGKGDGFSTGGDLALSSQEKISSKLQKLGNHLISVTSVSAAVTSSTRQAKLELGARGQSVLFDLCGEKRRRGRWWTATHEAAGGEVETTSRPRWLGWSTRFPINSREDEPHRRLNSLQPTPGLSRAPGEEEEQEEQAGRGLLRYRTAGRFLVGTS